MSLEDCQTALGVIDGNMTQDIARTLSYMTGVPIFCWLGINEKMIQPVMGGGYIVMRRDGTVARERYPLQWEDVIFWWIFDIPIGFQLEVNGRPTVI